MPYSLIQLDRPTTSFVCQ